MLSWTALQVRRSAGLVVGHHARRCVSQRTRDEKELGVEASCRVNEADKSLENELLGIVDNDTSESSEAYEESALEQDHAIVPGLRASDVSFTKAFAVPNGNVRTHRIRKHGKPSLPLSPVIDPVLTAARNKWQQTKAQPPKPEDMTDFQKKLYANPYAHALATPLRAAGTTDTHLPSFFLLPLTLQRSPEPPHKPTWIPSKLLASTLLPSSSATKPSLPQRTGPQTYVDLSPSVLQILERQAGRVRDIGNYATGQHISDGMRRNIIIRPRMGEFVLELLRRAVLKSLVWLFRHPNTGLVERCDRGAYAVPVRREGQKEVGCVMYLVPTASEKLDHIRERVDREVLEADILGRRARGLQVYAVGRLHETDARMPNSKNPAPIQNPEGVYRPSRCPLTSVTATSSSARVASTVVPVYTLHELLGEDKVAELVQDTVFADARCVLLRGEDVRTIKAQLALLRLQTFVGQERNMFNRTKGRSKTNEELQAGENRRKAS